MNLASHSMWTELSEAQRWWYFAQKGDHVQMFDSASGIGIVLTPQPHKLIQMVRTKNGPISRQIIKVIHDDSHKEVDNLSISPINPSVNVSSRSI